LHPPHLLERRLEDQPPHLSASAVKDRNRTGLNLTPMGGEPGRGVKEKGGPKVASLLTSIGDEADAGRQTGMAALPPNVCFPF